jgi:hypothetical protein
MKRLTFIAVMLSFFISAAPAQADWRWAPPKLKERKVSYSCSTMTCIRNTYLREKRLYKKKVAAHDKRRLKEWKLWTGRYIPRCTWYGESGHGPQYAKHRYTMPNSSGSGAYGKYQFMPGTYFSVGKYKDWSPLDQEIAARREYWRHGTQPWTNCG